MTRQRARNRMDVPPSRPHGVHPGRPGRFERWLAGSVAAVGCMVFAIAAGIDPYDASGRPRTHGTHRQLGLAPCVLRSTIDFPCPSCGMTTSISLLVHGDPVAAWRANWAGVLVAGAGGMAVCWLSLLAAGMPRRPRFSAESTILALTVAGAAAATVRYLALVGTALTASTP